jgi:hypothetical protein
LSVVSCQLLSTGHRKYVEGYDRLKTPEG